MKISAFILFLVPFFSFHAQPSYPGDPVIYTFGQWDEEDKTAVIFADVCNVRKSEDSKAEVSGRLTIGTEVSVLSVSKKTLTLNGITAPWVKIKSGKVSGYAWGATLTKGAQKLDDGKLALWGISEIKPTDSKAGVFASIRIADKGVLKYKQDFEVVHADRPNEGFLKVHPAPLLEGTQNLIVFETLSEACGVFSSDHYLLYGREGLQFVDSGYSMGDAGVLYTSKEFVFPYPKKEGASDYYFTPEAGHIFGITNVAELGEDCIWTETRTSEDFTWNGTELVKNCER
ncbi:MAG: hypothetical protein K0R65_2397 [Crocinitomicaceae bacterium]|nr:hypothetical protein [Crocinitomicaceae bacterium]